MTSRSHPDTRDFFGWQAGPWCGSLGRTADCLFDGDFIRLAFGFDVVPEEDRNRLLAHIEKCAYCALSTKRSSAPRRDPTGTSATP